MLETPDLDLKPDLWAVKRELAHVARKRLFTAPDLLGRISPDLVRPEVHVHVDGQVALLSLSPPADAAHIAKLERIYGNPYPGLYSVHGSSPAGALPIKDPDVFMYAHRDGNSLVGDIIFDLHPDSSFTMERFDIEAAPRPGERIRYRIYLLAALCFGKKLTLLNAVSAMDDLAGQHVHFSRIAWQRQLDAART